MPTIQRLVGVDDDIAELAAYLLSYSEPVALRFVDSVQSTLKQLAEMPGIGSLKAFANPRLANVRSWRVKGFPNHLILYEPMKDGIAVIHGARDLERFLRNRV
jgi:plasmid stabilization system protein ParE